jgi:hypothetical protein
MRLTRLHECLHEQGSALRLKQPFGTEAPPTSMFDRDFPGCLYLLDESRERLRQPIRGIAFLYSVQSHEQVTPGFIDVQQLPVRGEHDYPGILKADAGKPRTIGGTVIALRNHDDLFRSVMQPRATISNAASGRHSSQGNLLAHYAWL